MQFCAILQLIGIFILLEHVVAAVTNMPNLQSPSAGGVHVLLGDGGACTA